MMKTSLLIVVALLLTGCAIKFQWSASYMTDNLAADLRQANQSSKPAAVPVEKTEVPPAKPTTGETK